MSETLEPWIDLGKKERSFPINGQGIFFYTRKNVEMFSIVVTPDKFKEGCTPSSYIALRVNSEKARFVKKKSDSEEKDLPLQEGKTEQNVDIPGVEAEVMVTYWFSYDKYDMCLKYGKGYTMTETTQISYSFLKDPDMQSQLKEIRQEFFDEASKKYVWVYYSPYVSGKIHIEPTFRFSPNPFTVNYPPIVKDSSEVTLFDLDMDKHMFSKSLPLACQELYYNIKNCNLNYSPNQVIKLSDDNEDPIHKVKLSDAIRYSLETPGCLLNTKIKEKSNEFDGELETYLRVTLGPDKRTAPGIPYVLEIWPKSHMSPVHNHGGACAVIKVLFGEITVNIYNKLRGEEENGDPKVIKSFIAKEGDVTWIGSEWYQTHKLVNHTDDFCATIQCYRYEEADKIHYQDFDYVNTSGKGNSIKEFFPNSDFTFIELRDQVLKEYGNKDAVTNNCIIT